MGICRVSVELEGDQLQWDRGLLAADGLMGLGNHETAILLQWDRGLLAADGSPTAWTRALGTS